MRIRRLVVCSVLYGVAFAGTASGQRVQEVSNRMASHTVFIILITAAFLVWAASFSLRAYREQADLKEQHHALIERRARILDDLADLELARESGAITTRRYQTRAKKLRSELTRVLERQRAMAAAPKRRRRTS